MRSSYLLMPKIDPRKNQDKVLEQEDENLSRPSCQIPGENTAPLAFNLRYCFKLHLLLKT